LIEALYCSLVCPASEKGTMALLWVGLRWNNGAGRKRISHDSIVNLRVNPALVQSDTRAAGAATASGFTEALDDVGLCPDEINRALLKMDLEGTTQILTAMRAVAS
jgi:hypothetical protein